MARTRSEMHHEQLKNKIVTVAARRFLKYGYTDTTIKSITAECNISTGSFNNIFQTKEDVLCELVYLVLTRQFAATTELLRDKSVDKLLFYALETALQLHIVEMNENLRDVYSAAYSLPKPSALIQEKVTAKWEDVFREQLPTYTTKDFYKLEIATGGIMRGYMTIPCNMWFTIDQKVDAFLECSFRMYRVSDEKINEAKQFVKQFDLVRAAESTIESLFLLLEKMHSKKDEQ